jgi:hypothetical protein
MLAAPRHGLVLQVPHSAEVHNPVIITPKRTTFIPINILKTLHVPRKVTKCEKQK